MRDLKNKSHGLKSKKKDVKQVIEIDPIELAKRERNFDIFAIIILLAFGIYQSVLYFGHQTIPTADYPAFVRLGHQLLSFQYPSSFKRAPVLGMLQVSIGHIVNLLGIKYPDLTAGWFLNAALHPFNLVLMWLIGKKLVGRSAIWIAIVSIINPWTVRMLCDPIVETTYLFFILLTIYLIMNRSRWRYVFASLTMMVRYEGAALIMSAFVIDMIYYKSKKERIRVFMYSALASVPLVIWLILTIFNIDKEGSGHYFHVLFSKDYTSKFDASVETRTGWANNLQMLWQVGFSPLFIPYPKATEDFANAFWSFTKVSAVLSFLFGSIYGLLKRNWNILILLIFFIPYLWLHTVFQAIVPRYYMPIIWTSLLVCYYGLQSFWELINGKSRMPRVLVIILQIIIGVGAVSWLCSLYPYLSQTVPMSQTSRSLVYVAIILAMIIFISRIIVYRFKHLVRELSVLAVVCLFIISNQFSLVRIVGNGKSNIAFKMLADWYMANAKVGEKIVTTLPNISNIFVPEKRKRSFVHMEAVKGDDLYEFIKNCHEKGINYVAWDSRLGYNPKGRYYKIWGLKNIRMLSSPKNNGPYEFITTLRASRNSFINVFRLHRIGDKIPD